MLVRAWEAGDGSYPAAPVSPYERAPDGERAETAGDPAPSCGDILLRPRMRSLRTAVKPAR